MAYDGSGFSGWARQQGQRTVQQTLEDGLRRVLRLPAQPHLTVAGRTDAGVHARGQVAHVDLATWCWHTARETLHRSLSGVLPPDVRVLAIRPAPAGFDARFSALWRRYTYRVCDDPAGADPLRRRETLWYPRQVDVDVMNDAARRCLGEHDFAAFCRRRKGASTIRALLRLDWTRVEPGLVVADVMADAFCHNMVRALMGALLRVGDGSRPAAWPAEVLSGRVRDSAVTVMPAHALSLEEVGYPPDGQLSARALVTRQVRGDAGQATASPGPASPGPASPGPASPGTVAAPVAEVSLTRPRDDRSPSGC